ncbi:MAG: hypothetical protein ACO23R_16670, partial [bacterium]
LGQDGGGISHILIRRELHPRHDPVHSSPLSFLRRKTIAEVRIESVWAYLELIGALNMDNQKLI